jgi:hypothetical protein
MTSEWSQKYGSIFKFNLNGTVIVVVNDPEFIKVKYQFKYLIIFEPWSLIKSYFFSKEVLCYKEFSKSDESHLDFVRFPFAESFVDNGFLACSINRDVSKLKRSLFNPTLAKKYKTSYYDPVLLKKQKKIILFKF